MKTLLLAITALPVFMNEMSFAQAGNLDPTFNKQGFVTISVGTSSSASGLAVQPDGKIVAVGNSSNGTNNDIVLLRYKPNGKPDLSFGSGGKVITDLGGNESAYSTTVLANGKILVAGGKEADFLLLRYNKNGSLDSSFGTNGITVTDFDNEEETAFSMALQADGKIVLGGSSEYDNRFVMARYKANGAPDLSFGINGKAVLHFHTFYYVNCHAVAVQNDGKIVAAGMGPKKSDFLVVRLNSNGSLDSSFGKSGKAVTDISTFDRGNGMAIFPNGDIIVAGSSANPPDYTYFSLMKYSTNGQVDKSFGNKGNIQTYFFDDYNWAYDQAAFAVLIQADGKIMAAGTEYGNFHFAIARYQSNGKLDTSFGNNGKVITYEGESVAALAQQQDGKIIAAGSASNGGIIIARYIADDTLSSKLKDGLALRSSENGNFKTVKVYPNPVQSVLNVQFNNLSSSLKTINIYTSDGRLLRIKSVVTNTQLDMKSLTPGTYLIKINDEKGNELYYGKVIKE